MPPAAVERQPSTAVRRCAGQAGPVAFLYVRLGAQTTAFAVRDVNWPGHGSNMPASECEAPLLQFLHGHGGKGRWG
jgi:hypothetical protein